MQMQGDAVFAEVSFVARLNTFYSHPFFASIYSSAASGVAATPLAIK